MALSIERLRLQHYHRASIKFKSILYNFTLLRIFLMILSVESVICVRSAEAFQEVQNNDARYKRQILEDQSTPRGHASVTSWDKLLVLILHYIYIFRPRSV